MISPATSRPFTAACLALFAASLVSLPAAADENLFGYVKGAETLPAGARELYEIVTYREGKGSGPYDYEALDSATEFEYGFTDRFSMGTYFKMMQLDTSGLVIDGYLPGNKDFGLKPSGVEADVKYNFLKPAIAPVGLSVYAALDYTWIDQHSGEDKDTLSAEWMVILQKYFLDGQIVWVGNGGLESTFADRGEISDLPPDFDWPTDPEMELEPKLGTGLTYRFLPGWFVGGEGVYETEFETEVGQERWSLFAGPTLHYASKRWWLTATWFPQIEGGGEQYAGQEDTSLHLIEKTEQEYRVKAGLNF